MQSYDVVIIGGGIVGSATALALVRARPGLRVALLEKERELALHQSGRNSGVIHSGLYYRPGSLKALNCREGYARLLEFCRAERIPHEICGKIVVATRDEEIPRLDELHRRGEANGLAGLRRLTAHDIRDIEPHCAGIAGLHVPESGIVDYARVARAYAARASEGGADVLLGTRVERLTPNPDGVQVLTAAGVIQARVAVACAGLQSDRLARMTDPDLSIAVLPFRGEYYMVRPEAKHLVRNLIYPVPDPSFPFLGVHFTRTIDGGLECGPNAVLALGREAYGKLQVSPRDSWDALTWPGLRKLARRHWRTGLGEVRRSISKRAFVTALQRLVPDIRAAHLTPAPAGIRAQACDRDGVLVDDFAIREHGRAIHVLSAPSPAATASLAIGTRLSERALALVS